MALSQNGIIYMALMEKAMEDEVLTHEEKRILRIIRENMNIPENEVKLIKDHFGEGDNIDESTLDLSLLEDEDLATKYRNSFKLIVKEALYDCGISRDEFAMIFVLSAIIKISNEERELIFKEIKDEAVSDVDNPEVETRFDCLE